MASCSKPTSANLVIVARTSSSTLPTSSSFTPFNPTEKVDCSNSSLRPPPVTDSPSCDSVKIFLSYWKFKFELHPVSQLIADEEQPRKMRCLASGYPVGPTQESPYCPTAARSATKTQSACASAELPVRSGNPPRDASESETWPGMRWRTAQA